MNKPNPLTFSEGLIVKDAFSISQNEMDTFASLSGDLNPLHQSPDFSKTHHLKGPVVYGGLLVAKISKMLGMRLPGVGWIWHKLAVQFKNPLYVDDQAQLIGTITYYNEDLGIMRINVDIYRGDVMIATGEVQTGQLKK